MIDAQEVPDAERPPPGALTYLEDIHPMFEAAGCSTFACHGSMMAAGTLDKAVAASIPVIDGPVTVPSPQQTEAATKYLADNWAAAIG